MICPEAFVAAIVPPWAATSPAESCPLFPNWSSSPAEPKGPVKSGVPPFDALVSLAATIGRPSAAPISS